MLHLSGCIQSVENGTGTPGTGESEGTPESGSGTESEESGIPETPSPEPGTPSYAFLAFRQALADRDYTAFLQYAHSSVLEEIPGEMTFNQMAQMISSYQPLSTIVIENEEIQGNSATITLSDNTDPNSVGTVQMEMEGGAWKIVREDWETSM